MYKTRDYIHNGVLYLNNIIRPRHKKLSTLMIYSTTKCQSRCKHCSIWQKPVEHLSLEDIKNVMKSKCVTRNTTVGLEGGEFILHKLFGDIVYRTELHAFHGGMHFGIVCHDNERLHLSLLSHPAQKVNAVTVRQAQVGNHDVIIRRLLQMFLRG